jgi:RNA polymerase sigma factor (sigma-70 family)
MSNEDFNLKITVRNGRLLKAIRERYESVSDLARKINRNPSGVNSLVTMRQAPTNQHGWTDLALDVSAMVGKDPEDLWPEHMREIKLKKSSAEVSLDLDSVKNILSNGSVEKNLSQITALKELSERLTPREKEVLNRRFHEKQSLGEVAKVFNVTRERVRHIEAKALRRMRMRALQLGYSADDRSEYYAWQFSAGQKARDLLDD